LECTVIFIFPVCAVREVQNIFELRHDCEWFSTFRLKEWDFPLWIVALKGLICK